MGAEMPPLLITSLSKVFYQCYLFASWLEGLAVPIVFKDGANYKQVHIIKTS